MFCQIGFVVGPILGNMIYEASDFFWFCVYIGGAQAVFGLLWVLSEARSSGARRALSTSSQAAASDSLRTPLV